MQVFDGDFSDLEAGLPILAAITVSLLASLYFALNVLRRSGTRGGINDLIRGAAQDADEDDTIVPAEDAADQSTVENQDGSSPADFRAAGDGWEGDDDIDYVIDDDLLNQGKLIDLDSKYRTFQGVKFNIGPMCLPAAGRKGSQL